MADTQIVRIDALYYRSLRYVAQDLGPFEVLVGPNASGKSTFLDVVSFLSDLVRAGVLAAVEGDSRLGIGQRAPDAKQLTWMRQGSRFELAVEAKIPEERRGRLKDQKLRVCRYEVAIDVSGPPVLAAETLWLKPEENGRPHKGGRKRRRKEFAAQPEENGRAHKLRSEFPGPLEPPETIVSRPRTRAPEGWRRVLSRGEDVERVTFCSETSGWRNPFRLGADKAALASLPEDDEKFPVATWFRWFLLEGVQRLVLSSEAMRRPSPPGRSQGFLPDGSNLPHVIHQLETKAPERLKEWLGHVREALPDVENIFTREREEDRSRYLVIRFRTGLEAPSWLVSDGTLRLLALTLLAYADTSGVYLIEEPENGIHPRAIEIVIQSLSSVYGAQVLLATHSPVVVSQVSPEKVLCFARTQDGITDIVRGSEHPRLREWQHDVDFGTLFASGVLG